MSGILPGNKKTALPLFPFSLLHLWDEPYSEWALAPLHELSGTPNERVMVLMGSFEDLTRLVTTEIALDHAKAKIWEGIGLMSDAWWLTKKLDDQRNVNEALQYIKLAVGVFEYLHMPEIQRKMRETYNLVYEELVLFQNAINLLREELEEPPLQITAMFEQFIKATFDYVEVQARDWVFRRLKSLRAIWKGRILDVFLSGRPLNSTQGTVIIDHLAHAIYQRLIEAGLNADIKIMVPLDGFKGLSIEMSPPNTDTQSYTSDQLKDMFSERMQAREDKMNAHYTARLAERIRKRHESQSEPFPEFLESSLVMFDREFAHIEMQPAIDIYRDRGPEPWIQYLLYPSAPPQFGFVAYRICNNVNDQDWAAFLKKLEAGINTWSGVGGFDHVKSKPKLQWLDGRKLDISDGDVKAVKKHFRSFSTSDQILPGMVKTICLAIDSTCIAAFDATSGSRDLRTGPNADYRGFLLAIDSSYDEDDPPAQNSVLPGYKGMLKVVDRLIWTDLYALLQSQAQTLNDIWGMAFDHPSQVYVGPSVAIQQARWKQKKAESSQDSAVLALRDFALED